MQRTRSCSALLAFALILSPILGCADCLEPKDKAILDGSTDTNYLGGSYCREDDGISIPVRGIRNTMAFETSNAVCIYLKPSTADECPANSNLPKEVMLTVENVSGDDFLANLGKDIGEVSLRPRGSTLAYWLQGKKKIGTSEFEIFLYLLDEPQASSEIYKHYRLEVFDKNCKGQPHLGTNFFLKSLKHLCPGTIKKAQNEEQTGSGDGYEPKK